MKKNITFIVLFLLAFTASFAQSSLNDYKYVIVPNKYEFLKTEDEYRLNWLTKSLFEELKFKTLMHNDSLPADLRSNGCLALKVDVLNESKIFKTQLKIQLKNCDGKIVYTSQSGVSREKKYKKAYHEALRMAFKFLEAENYNYEPNKKVLAKVEATKKAEIKEIQKLKAEIKELKAEKKVEVVSVKEVEKQPIVKKNSASKKEMIKETKTEDNILTAKLIPGSVFSYSVENNRGEAVYTLLFSGKPDFYMVKGRDAIVYKVNNKWVIAQYNNNDLQVKVLDIKF